MNDKMKMYKKVLYLLIFYFKSTDNFNATIVNIVHSAFVGNR